MSGFAIERLALTVMLLGSVVIDSSVSGVLVLAILILVVLYLLRRL